MRNRWVGLGALAASLAFLALALSKTYHKIPKGSLHFSPAFAVCAVLLVALANSWSAFVWRVLLAPRGIDLPFRESLRIISLSQLGKYLPGGFWQPVGWVGLGRSSGIAAGVGSVSIGMTMILIVAAALVVGPVLLVLSHAAGSFVWLLLVLPLALGLIHPRTLEVVLAFAARITRRPGLDVGGVPFNHVIVAFLLAVPVWLIHGTALLLTAHALHMTGGGWALMTGAFAVAWSVGFLALPFPGGLGIRETVLVILLGGALTTAQGLLLVVVFRLVFIVAEALMTGLALVIPRGHVRDVANTG